VLRTQKVVAGRSSEPAARPVAMLRTQILQALRVHNFDAFAVASPTPGCGCSFLAVNLAFSIARQPSLRVVLLDLNLARPSLGKALGVPRRIPDFSLMDGTVDLPQKFVRLGDNLALGYNATALTETSERLQDMADGGVIERVRRSLRPDVIIVDVPPILRSDDFVALAPQLGGVLLVADGQRTTPDDVAASEALLENRTRLIGVVLNRGKGA
jgi:Mrp family chromosome partitioning ATPase